MRNEGAGVRGQTQDVRGRTKDVWGQTKDVREQTSYRDATTSKNVKNVEFYIFHISIQNNSTIFLLGTGSKLGADLKLRTNYNW